MKRLAYISVLFVIVFCLLTSGPAVLAQELRQPEPTETAERDAYTCLFMGHSFFAPIARAFAAHPARCGLKAHEQYTVFHRGTGGAPGSLWASEAKDVARAKKLLTEGEIDLVGMTFHPDKGSELADYKRWIDLALEHNPETRFFIMTPWPRYKNRTFAEYEKAWKAFHTHIHGLIDQLREAYPDTTIFCIPQGQWMVELWRMFEQGNLPEVSVLLRPEGGGTDAYLFRDTLGHGGRLPAELGALLWLAVIYDVNLAGYEWDTGCKTDLKALAQRIADADPYAAAGAAAGKPEVDAEAK